MSLLQFTMKVQKIPLGDYSGVDSESSLVKQKSKAILVVMG